MGKDKVSIIIPAYNVEKYIYRAIESSLEQTYNNIEVVIVDDGSTDNTWSIIEEYKKKDSRLIAIKQENSGVSSARNKALSVATGNYVIFLDSDDWLEKNAVQYLIDLKKKKNNLLVSVDWFNAYFDKEGEICRKKSREENEIIELSCKEAIIDSCKGKHRLASSCYKLYNLDIIRKNNITFDVNIKHGEDGLFVYEYLHYEDGFYYINKPLWNILDRVGSATTSPYNHTWMTAIEAAKKRIEFNKINKIAGIDEALDIYMVRRTLDVLHTALSTKLTEDVKTDIKDLKDILRKNKKKHLFKSENYKKRLYYFIMAYTPICILNLYFRKKAKN